MMSLVANDFPPIDALIASWHPNTDYGPNATDLFEELVPKFEAGFNLSYIEFIGRSIGYEFLVRIRNPSWWNVRAS